MASFVTCKRYRGPSGDVHGAPEGKSRLNIAACLKEEGDERELISE